MSSRSNNNNAGSNRANRHYVLGEQIGRGGFGTVHRGKAKGDSGFEKEVAIKVLNMNAMGTGELASRLRDEARVLSALRHRAIVGVEDLVQIDGQWAVVMELVEGADLAALIKLGPLPPRTVAEIACEVAFALQAAHSARAPDTGEPMYLVHRDIKPGNIRITPQGEIKVLDFGVARARFPQRETRTDSLSFGSWGYMAPERFDEIEGASSDIYALGAVIYEALSGARLRQLSVNPERHARSLTRALHQLPIDHVALLALLERMMAYAPDRRPTAGEVASELRGLLSTIPGHWVADWAGDALTRLTAVAPETVVSATPWWQHGPTQDAIATFVPQDDAPAPGATEEPTGMPWADRVTGGPLGMPVDPADVEEDWPDYTEGGGDLPIGMTLLDPPEREPFNRASPSPRPVAPAITPTARRFVGGLDDLPVVADELSDNDGYTVPVVHPDDTLPFADRANVDATGPMNPPGPPMEDDPTDTSRPPRVHWDEITDHVSMDEAAAALREGSSEDPEETGTATRILPPAEAAAAPDAQDVSEEPEEPEDGRMRLFAWLAVAGLALLLTGVGLMLTTNREGPIAADGVAVLPREDDPAPLGAFAEVAESPKTPSPAPAGDEQVDVAPEPPDEAPAPAADRTPLTPSPTSTPTSLADPRDPVPLEPREVQATATPPAATPPATEPPADSPAEDVAADLAPSPAVNEDDDGDAVTADAAEPDDDAAPPTPTVTAAAVATPPEPTPPEPAPPEPAPRSAPALSGTWQGQAFNRPLELTLNFAASGSLSGQARVRLGADDLRSPVRGSWSKTGDDRGAIEFTETEGARPATYRGTWSGRKASGEVIIGGKTRGTWQADFVAG